jgi:hypothetical protein
MRAQQVQVLVQGVRRQGAYASMVGYGQFARSAAAVNYVTMAGDDQHASSAVTVEYAMQTTVTMCEHGRIWS